MSAELFAIVDKVCRMCWFFRLKFIKVIGFIDMSIYVLSAYLACSSIVSNSFPIVIKSY